MAFFSFLKILSDELKLDSLMLTTKRSVSSRVELCYNVMKGTEYFVSLQTSVFITEEYNVRLTVMN
jgi:hypothetical protein